MIKKIFLTVFFATLVSFAAGAQGKYGPDSAECVRYLTFYNRYMDMDAMEEAIPRWRKAYELCPPTASQNMLIDGQKFMRTLIAKNSMNAIYKDALIDTLMTLHDARIATYPTYAVTARNNKSLDMINYVTDNNKLYEVLRENMSYTKDKTNNVIYVRLMNAANALYSQGSIMAEDVMAVFGEITTNITTAIDKNKSQNKSTASLEAVLKDVESLFIASNVASCDRLIELFTPRFDATPNDKALVSNIIMMLSSAENCTDNDLFMNAATSMHKLDPSYTSAYFLYRLYSSRGDVDNALKYIEEAISYPESDDAQDAAYYYEAAAFAFKNADNASAFKYANMAAGLDPSLAGKSYMLIGTIWGSLVCQGNEIERRAPYWVAVDYMEKARKADPSLAEEAAKHIAQYRQYYPQAAEAFMYNITEGDSYTVSCGGMRAITTVRTQQ